MGGDEATIVAFVVVWSFVSGPPVVLFATIIGQLFGGPDVYSYLSLFFVFGGVGAFIGPVIAGTFIPSGSAGGGGGVGVEGFDKLAIFCGVMSLTACGVMCLVRWHHSRRLLYKI